jgi:hypothetical protein
MGVLRNQTESTRTAVVVLILVAASVVAFYTFNGMGLGIVYHLRPAEKIEERWSNGTLKSVHFVRRDRRGNYLRDGKYTTYHENGMKSTESTFKHNILEGQRRAWNDQGEVVNESTFKNGRPWGYDRWYHHGKLCGIYSYLSGVYNGFFEEYDSTGLVTSVGTYSNGVRTGVEVTCKQVGARIVLNLYKYNSEGIAVSVPDDGTGYTTRLRDSLMADFTRFYVEY